MPSVCVREQNSHSWLHCQAAKQIYFGRFLWQSFSMRKTFSLLSLAAILVCPFSAPAAVPVAQTGATPDAEAPALVWRVIEDGLELAEVNYRPNPARAQVPGQASGQTSGQTSGQAVAGGQAENPVITPPAPQAQSALRAVLLRIDQQKFAFSLHMASAGGQAKPLAEWVKENNLSAAINASMYLPDGLTSTGYLRGPGHSNNKRLNERFGAFLVAEPQKNGLPGAAVLEKEGDAAAMREKLEQYSVVAQNFRLLTSAGESPWPEGGRRAGVALIGQDNAGAIYFILIRTPLTPAEAARFLRALPLNFRTVMYVEGGSEAGLALREGENCRVWHGMGRLGGLGSLESAPGLPNVIGIKPRSGAVCK